jgi:hypothetical protein
MFPGRPGQAWEQRNHSGGPDLTQRRLRRPVHGGAEVIKMDGAGVADGPGHRPPADIVELRLTGEQIGLLRREGEVRPVAAGEVLFREGDRGYDFIVILAGRVAIVDHQAGTERELATGGRGTLSPSSIC